MFGDAFGLNEGKEIYGLGDLEHIVMHYENMGVQRLDDIFSQAPPFLEDCKLVNKAIIDVVLILKTAADPQGECADITECTTKLIKDSKNSNGNADYSGM